MADKTVTAVVTLGVACPKKSVPLKKKGDDGKVVVVPGEYERVELKHVEPGETVTLDADEADELIKRGFAKEVEAPAKASKSAPAA